MRNEKMLKEVSAWNWAGRSHESVADIKGSSKSIDLCEKISDPSILDRFTINPSISQFYVILILDVDVVVAEATGLIKSFVW